MRLQEDAIFITDAHYQKGVREAFLEFLQDIASSTINCNQLFFLGDMFDLLVGEVAYTIAQNREVIDLINKISQKKEIIYLEGNHDFNLQKIFPNISVVPYQKQPLVLKYHNQKIALSHGDKTFSTRYKLYVKLIRNSAILRILNILDHFSNNLISKTILQKQKNKNICKKIENFSHIAKQKFKIYDISGNRYNLLCEGHYHIDHLYEQEDFSYRVLDSFACEGVYYRLTLKGGVVFKKMIKG